MQLVSHRNHSYTTSLLHLMAHSDLQGSVHNANWERNNSRCSNRNLCYLLLFSFEIYLVSATCLAFIFLSHIIFVVPFEHQTTCEILQAIPSWWGSAVNADHIRSCIAGWNLCTQRLLTSFSEPDDENVLISRGSPFGVTSTNNNLLNLEQHRSLRVAVAETGMGVVLHVGLMIAVAMMIVNVTMKVNAIADIVIKMMKNHI